MSTTKHRRTLIGSRSTTYAYDNGPGRTRRFAAFTGIAPYNPKRLTITAWVTVVLLSVNLTPWLPTLLIGLSAAGFLAWRIWKSRAAVLPAPRPVVLPGPVWCDHCADWTVHPTNQHAA